jgi:cytochrome c oxidase cbb3-type subunit 3
MSKKIIYTTSLFTGSILFLSAPAYAGGPQEPSLLNHPVALAMFAAQIVLLIIIAVLAGKLLGRARFKSKLAQKIRESKSSAVILVLFLLLPSVSLFSQITTVTKDTDPAGSPTIGGMDPISFYIMAAVLIAEIAVALVLYFNVRSLKKTREEEEIALAHPSLTAKPVLSWWDRFNKFRPAEQEADIDLGHDYDGIRELDNKLPPWWIYGFYITIVFAGIYLWRYHVSQTAPSSKQEFERSVARAEARINAYLKSTGTAIDENNVTLLTAQTDLAEGKNIFVKSCAPCHQETGAGNVGPNLTDDYWIHGGDIKSIFKIIRYGFNAMPPWQNAYSNKQIAQLTSYVKSLKGTNPPNPKAPQGELYKEEVKPLKDSSAAKENKTTPPK